MYIFIMYMNEHIISIDINATKFYDLNGENDNTIRHIILYRDRNSGSDSLRAADQKVKSIFHHQ